MQSREPGGFSIFVRAQKPDESELVRALRRQPDRERRGEVGRKGQGMSIQGDLVCLEWHHKLDLRPMIAEANDRSSRRIKTLRCIILTEVSPFLASDCNNGRADALNRDALFKVGSSDDDRISWNDLVVSGIAIRAAVLGGREEIFSIW